MRYQNWDVLLFPGPSRVPIQEFETKFHVLTSGTAPIASIDDPFTENRYESLNKLPFLTCFIGSLTEDTPFRISLHSWARPTASTILSAYKTKEEALAFQARAYIDGVHQCSRTFSEMVAWPQVMEYSDSNKELRFPPFHHELLQQASWDAAEQLGRIRIVIAEGIMRNKSFDRLRDVIAFSFQHAPLHVLEHSALAWPNPRAFATAPDVPRMNRTASRGAAHEAHAHRAVGPKPLDDPFIGGPPAPQWRLRTRATRPTDESMPDVDSRRTGSEISIETSSVQEETRTTRSSSLVTKRKRSVSEGDAGIMGAKGLQGIQIG